MLWNYQVLKYLNQQLFSHKNLTDKDLTLKLTMMPLALTAASRCLELKYLSTGFMIKLNDK